MHTERGVNAAVRFLGPAQQYRAFQEQPELMRPDESHLTEYRTTYLLLHLLPSFISFITAAVSLSVIKTHPHSTAVVQHLCMYVCAQQRKRSESSLHCCTLHEIFFKKAQLVWNNFMEQPEDTCTNCP